MTIWHNKWLQHLLGIDTGSIPEDATLRLTWTNLPRSWEVFAVIGVVAAVIYLVYFLYRKEIDTCPRWAKTTLAVVRALVLLLLLIVYLAPALTFTETRLLVPNLLLLRDDSQSMATVDRYLDQSAAAAVGRARGQAIDSVHENQQTRAELAASLFEADDRRLIDQLERRGRLRVVNFSNRTETFEPRPARTTQQSRTPRPSGATPNESSPQRAVSLRRHRASLAAAGGLLLLGGLAGIAFLVGRTRMGSAVFSVLALAGGLAVWTATSVRNPTIAMTEVLGLESSQGVADISGANTSGAETDPAGQAPEPLPPWEPAGQGTDLHKAITDALTDRLIAAVVMFTDGQHTGKDDPREAARKALQRGTPLLVVGVGDPNRPRNLAIADVYADPQVWQDDPFQIQAVLRAQGAGGETVRLRLSRQKIAEDGTPSGGTDILETREVVIPDDNARVPITFTHTTSVAGRFAFSVRVEPIENEVSEEDNEPPSPVAVKVLSEQARVLLVAGAPSWEYQGLQQLLSREKSVDLSCWLQTLSENRAQEGNTVIETLPASPEDLFQYDVIILLDPDPKEFDTEWIDWLKRFASEHAGGVLYMAGPKFASVFLDLPRTRPMRDLLPVRLGDVGGVEVAPLFATNTRPWLLGVVAANVDQPMMRFFAEPEKSLRRWQTLPGIFWSFPCEKAKPSARVLIEHTDPTLQQADGSRPLLVTGRYGAGRTAYLGFNGTWRWRKVGRNGEFFNRFWVQTTRYLVEGRSLEGKRRGVVETDRSRYEVGDRIAISARLKNASYRPLDTEQVVATLSRPGAPPLDLPLQVVPNEAGHFQATLTARHTGRHLLRVALPDESGQPPTIECTFQISLPSVETRDVWLNKPLLVELADASGGRYFDVDQLDDMIAAIPDRTQKINVQSKPVPLWDTSRTLLLLVALLSIEWAARKRFKLL